VGWAVIQPVMSMVIFSIVFGGLAEIRSDGVPYPLFSLAALVPWTYFSSAVIDSTGGLVKNANMLQKVYFPRLIIPLAAVLGRLVDFVIAFCLLLIMMFAFGWFFTPGVLILPVLILTMMIGAAGMGMWLSALSVQYRDINYGMGFALQLLMYVSPVVYPVSLVAEKAGAYSFIVWIYALNPMVGVIQGFRSALLGTVPLPWDLIAIGGASALFLAVSGMLYFLNREHLFADVV
jgi:lipopolysaccharide transport system permease protein